MRGSLVSLPFVALSVSGTGLAHRSSCEVIEGTDFATCGAHNEEGAEMSLLIASPEVTTAVNSAILCAGTTKKFSKVEATWVEFEHDDYIGEIPAEPIVSRIDFSHLNDNCAVLKNIGLNRKGAWEVEVTFVDKDSGTFFLEVEEAVKESVETPVSN